MLPLVLARALAFGPCKWQLKQKQPLYWPTAPEYPMHSPGRSNCHIYAAAAGDDATQVPLCPPPISHLPSLNITLSPPPTAACFVGYLPAAARREASGRIGGTWLPSRTGRYIRCRTLRGQFSGRTNYIPSTFYTRACHIALCTAPTIRILQ